MTAAIALALAGLMLAIAVSDWRRYRVPNPLVALALSLRAGALAATPDMLLDAAIRAATMAALFYLFRAGYRRWRGREGMGLGDVKLSAVAGAWVEWRWLPYVVEAAALFALVLALLRARRTGSLRADMKLPFAVGFAPAIFLGWSFGRLGF